MKELAKRISVALWGIPLLLYLTYEGGYFFALFTLIVNGMALWEFYRMFENQQIFAHKILGTVLSSVFLVATFFYPEIWNFGVIATIALMLLAHLQIQKGLASTNTVYTISGFVYITLLLSALLNLRLAFAGWSPTYAMSDAHIGGYFVIVFFASIWICDTAAYFGGRLMGKHKLAPNVSPNKTIEGAAFGFIFGIISFWGLAAVLVPEMRIEYAIVSGAIVGVFGQIGDLIESRFKRDAGVKDTSALLPGHGGFFDRFDSIIFVSPFLWTLFKFQLLG